MMAINVQTATYLVNEESQIGPRKQFKYISGESLGHMALRKVTCRCSLETLSAIIISNIHTMDYRMTMMMMMTMMMRMTIDDDDG
jgi:hypothetical protein